MRVLRICRPYLGKFWLLSLVAFGAMALQTLMDLAGPWPLKVVFDNVLGKSTFTGPVAAWLNTISGGRSQTRLGLLVTMVAALVVFALFRAVFAFLGGILTASIGQRVIYEVRLHIFDHMQRLSLSFHRQNRVGDLAARLTTDFQSIQDMLSSGVNTLITNALTLVGVLIIVTWVDWRFAVLMVCATPLLLFVAGAYRSRIRKASRQWRNFEGQVGATAQEKLNAIQVVQGFTNEDDEAVQFALQTRRSLRAGLIVSRLQSELTPLVDLVGVVTVAAITWMGAREVIFGHITPGYLLLFITYFRSTLSPVRQLAKLSSQFSKAEASAERIQEILDIQGDVRDRPGAETLHQVHGAITLRHVSFAYTSDTPILQGIDLTIQPGMKVALVGATGSGKSTLLSLIPRFHDPVEGQVLLDNHDLRSLTLRSVRDQISMVFQDPILFTGSIRDNIAYGRPNASDVEILRAAKAAHVHEFVQRLPLRYGTIIGERGSTLSGGQRQRIAIARAFIRNAPILLLDEPTSGLDAESEALVMQALERLMLGRTSIVIAHRLNTIERADMIIVIDQGRIRERGSHATLLRDGGLYAHWYALQHETSNPNAQGRHSLMLPVVESSRPLYDEHYAGELTH